MEKKMSCVKGVPWSTFALNNDIYNLRTRKVTNNSLELLLCTGMGHSYWLWERGRVVTSPNPCISGSTEMCPDDM